MFHAFTKRLEICTDIKSKFSYAVHYMWIFTSRIFRLALKITFFLKKYFFMQMTYSYMSYYHINIFVSYFNFCVSGIRGTFVKENYLKLVTIYNHFVIVKPINCCFTFWFQNLQLFFEYTCKLAKVLSSAKLWTVAFGIKKKKVVQKNII